MISCIDFIIEVMLRKLLQQNQIMAIPTQPGMRCNLLKSHIKDEKIIEMIDFYLLLRQINRSDFSREKEYRRHVTMTCVVEGQDVKIDIDNITEYYKKTKDYIEYVTTLVRGEKQ
jgi:hypothetical protein